MRGKTEISVLTSVTLFALLIATAAVGEVISFDDNWGEAGFNLISQDGAGVEIVFSISEIAIIDQEIDGQIMQLVQFPGINLPNNAGAPNLPGSGRYIAMPQGALANLQIIATRTEIFHDMDIAPAPPIPKETDDSPPIYIKDLGIYSLDEYYPEDPTQLSKLTKMRGVDVALLGITPFQYNPVTRELVVYKDIRVRIDFVGGNGHFGEDRLRSRYWDPLLRQHLLNFASLPEVDYNRLPISDEDNCEYVIIVPDDPVFIAWADTIKQWRTRQGIITGITTLSEIGGNDHNLISTYLINAYYTWDIPPVAVLLLSDYQNSGDDYGIDSPTWDGYCLSDNMYADVDGNNLPEFAMARITAQNEDHLATMIGKFLDYERTPPLAPNFYDEPIMAGGWQTERWFILCTEIIYGYFETQHNKHPVREYAIYSGNPGSQWSTNQNTWMILNYFGPNGLGYVPADPSYLNDWGGNAARLNDDINSGAFLLQHRDHGWEGGWGEPAYNIGNLSGLSNTMLPFVFSTNCCTGEFGNGYACFAEAFHRMDHGALGIIAATGVSYSFVNDTYQWGVYDSMWPDFDPGYGSDMTGPADLRPCFGNVSGKYYLSTSPWPSNTNNKVVTYNLFHHHGDAFITLFSEVPQSLAVTHAPVLFAGASEFTVTADEGAIIALTVNDEIIGVTEATGSAQIIPIDPQLPGNPMLVTITKLNHFRYIEEVDVITLQNNFVVYHSMRINDENGNNNQLLDLGEDVLLSVAVKNLGTQTANDIEVTISTEDQYVDVVDSTEIYATILSGGYAMADDAFEILISGGIPDDYNVEFQMSATDGDSIWISYFTTVVHAPVVAFQDVSVDDIAGGNGDNHLDPGETVDFGITVQNDGSGDCEDLTFTLSCTEPLVTISNNSVNLDELISGEQAEITFVEIIADAGITQGDTLEFSLEITAASGYSNENSFSLVIGDLRHNPIGPDEYGYWAYDLYDGNNAPDYDWVEIAPQAGGPGTNLNLGNSTFSTVSLPFTFQFYGIDYDLVSVGSHGWIEFGTTTTFVPMNISIPHFVPPNQMVAAYWSDLAPGDYGQVCTYDDEENDRFIVEWFLVPHESDPMAFETFQIQLFNPAVYPTLSGDGEIVVNYNIVSDLNDECTVGIEDSEGAIGLEFLYNGSYDDRAMPLEDLFAIKYSTMDPSVAVQPDSKNEIPVEFALGQAYPNPFNPTTTLSFALPKANRVHLAVYDIAGRLVTTLTDGFRQAGIHTVIFESSGLSSGVYIYRIEAGEYVASGKMVLMK